MKRTRSSRQQGTSLIVSLVMLIAVLMLGTSAAQIALQGEKASRNDRDRQIALLAAEAALIDAERDIEQLVRSDLFENGNPEIFENECGSEEDHVQRGPCRTGDADMPIWKTLDLTRGEGLAKSVPYGHFTGRAMQTGEGPMPAKLPRYIIERMSYKKKQDPASAGNTEYFYRITAIGFGMRETTQVMLQSLYRKYAGRQEPNEPAGRLSWREVGDWQEMRNASN